MLHSMIYFKNRIEQQSLGGEEEKEGEGGGGGRFERRKARVEFRVRNDDSGGVVFLRVRARTGATPSPRSKAKYSGGTLTDEIVCNLGRVWPTPPTLSPTRESFFDVGRKRCASLSPLPRFTEEESRGEISRDNGEGRA